MSRLYEYRSIEVRPHSWPEAAEQVGTLGRRAVEEAGARLFGLWTGQIGMGSNEGVAMTVWPDEATVYAGTDEEAFRVLKKYGLDSKEVKASALSSRMFWCSYHGHHHHQPKR